ncbi:MAG TPA: hypothetical protein VNA22_02605 [Pyrinomonadaceae bacterium]|nr:hypothetical protein [Pyrinomonadaceae bacterium]
MEDQPTSKSPFWSSLPGIFTGLGAVIVAITGLITALYSTGVVGSRDSNAVAPATTSVALAAEPEAESEGYGSMTGEWEVIEEPAHDFDEVEQVTWRYEAEVSGNVPTLTGKILAIDGDKNLTDDAERISATFVTTLLGSSGVGEYKVKRTDGTVINDATIRLGDDLNEFQGKIDAGGQTYTLTGRKL